MERAWFTHHDGIVPQIWHGLSVDTQQVSVRPAPNEQTCQIIGGMSAASASRS
jgi:hypothetical protein